jgi:hypothetical protein
MRVPSISQHVHAMQPDGVWPIWRTRTEHPPLTIVKAKTTRAPKIPHPPGDFPRASIRGSGNFLEFRIGVPAGFMPGLLQFA